MVVTALLDFLCIQKFKQDWALVVLQKWQICNVLTKAKVELLMKSKWVRLSKKLLNTRRRENILKVSYRCRVYFCTFAFCTYVWAVLPGNCCMLKQSVNKNDKMWLIPLTTNMHYGLNSEYSWSINSVNRIFKRLLIKKSIKRDEFKETVICLWLFCK